MRHRMVITAVLILTLALAYVFAYSSKEWSFGIVRYVIRLAEGIILLIIAVRVETACKRLEK